MTIHEEDETIDVLIDLSEASLIDQDGIKADYLKLLREMKLRSGKISWIARSGLVDKTWLLTLLKIIGSASLQDIIKAVKENFPYIEESQVKKKIESLRRSGEIIWQPPHTDTNNLATYALTKKGLDIARSFIGTQSPDVRRALYLSAQCKKCVSIANRSGE